MNATANPFSAICNQFHQITHVLMRSAITSAPRSTDAPPQSRTESIRAVLRQAGRPMSAAEILLDADLPYSANTSLVSMLLKWDIRQARVRFEDGLYSWNSETAAAEAAEVRAALRLLRRHGYVCTQQGVA